LFLWGKIVFVFFKKIFYPTNFFLLLLLLKKSIFAGYFSARTYKLFKGVEWKKNMLLVRKKNFKKTYMVSKKILIPSFSFFFHFVVFLKN
jgi:hypothetical protein